MLQCFGRLSDLGECGGSRSHQDLSHSVVKALHWLIINTQETLCRSLLCYLEMKIQWKENLKTEIIILRKTEAIVATVTTIVRQYLLPQQQRSIPHLILQVPHTIFVSKLLIAGTAFWQYAALKTTHVEKQVGVVFAVDWNKTVLPLDSGHWSGQSVLDVPENSTSTGRHKIRIV